MSASLSIPGSISYLLIWIIIFALPILVMIGMHMYLSMKRRRVYPSFVACFLLLIFLQLILTGTVNPDVMTLFQLGIFLYSLYLAFQEVKKYFEWRGETRRQQGVSGNGTGDAVVTVTGDHGTGDSDPSQDIDVILTKHSGKTRTLSALRISPTMSAVQPQGCLTLLTTLSKFTEEKNDTSVEWSFKIDINQNDAQYIFLISGEGKEKKKSPSSTEALVNLTRSATLYLRSALRSVGLVEEELSTIPAADLMSIAGSGASQQSKDKCGGSSTADISVIRGLPQKMVRIEEGRQNHSTLASAQLLQDGSLPVHPVTNLVRLMAADNLVGSYIVSFRATDPPEGITVVNGDAIQAMTGARSWIQAGDGRLRVGARDNVSRLLIRSSVAERLRLADGDDLAEEVISGVRRGYWNVGARVIIKRRDGEKKRKAGQQTNRSDYAASSGEAVKIASSLISIFSGGARSIDVTTYEGMSGYDILTCEPLLARPRSPKRGNNGAISLESFETGDMSSDSLASFLSLSSPYAASNASNAKGAEFEVPCRNSVGHGILIANGGGNPPHMNGNGLLHLGRAYFQGAPVGDIAIQTKDLAMHMIVLGETGLGKTTFAAGLMRQLWDIDPVLNWTIVDLKGEYISRLKPHIKEEIKVLKAGLTEVPRVTEAGVTITPLRINLLADNNGDGEEARDSADTVFSILRESLAGLFKDNAELSPMMERILLESLRKTAVNNVHNQKAPDEDKGFFDLLFKAIDAYTSQKDVKNAGSTRRDITMSKEALKNRLERFRRGVIGQTLASTRKGETEDTDFRRLLHNGSKIIIDLSECPRKGCTKEDIRLLFNLLNSIIFEEASRNGLTSDSLRHLTLIEEANLLVPEVLRRRTTGDLTTTEDMILTARGFGEGLILVAQRPTISSFILANAGTKIVFRSPYDSKKVGEFMGLNQTQQDALKTLKKFEAIVTTIQGGPYRVSKTDVGQSLLDPQLRNASVAREIKLIGVRDKGKALRPPRSKSEIGNRRRRGDEGGTSLLNCRKNNRNMAGASAAADAKRLLRRSSSDRLSLFTTVATSPASTAKASEIILRVFEGRWQRYLDALRDLTEKPIWRKKLLVANNTTIKLTEHGVEVWKAIQQNKPRQLGTEQIEEVVAETPTTIQLQEEMR